MSGCVFIRKAGSISPGFLGGLSLGVELVHASFWVAMCWLGLVNTTEASTPSYTDQGYQGYLKCGKREVGLICIGVIGERHAHII